MIKAATMTQQPVPSPQSADEAPVALPWRDVVRAIVRHRRLVVTLTAVGGLLMAVDKFFEPPMYKAAAVLTLSATRADAKVSPDEMAPSQTARIDEMAVNSEATWLQSEGVLREVMKPWRDKAGGEAGGLWDTVTTVIGFPFEVPTMVYRWMHGAPQPSAFDGWVASVQNRLEVAPVRTSNVIELSFTDANPTFASKLLEALIGYRMNRQMAFSQQDEAQGFYEKQSRLLAERVRTAEESLQEFYEREGIVGGTEERDGVRDRLAAIRTSFAETQTELAEARVRADYLEQAIRKVPRRTSDSGSGGSMQDRVLELMLERSKLLSRYAATSIKITDLDHQIAEAKRLLRQEQALIDAAGTVNPTYAEIEQNLIETRSNVVALEAKAGALSEQEHSHLERMRDLVKGASILEQLEMTLERTKEAHRTYVGKEESARFSSALDASQILDILVTQAPAVPDAPVAGQRLAYTLLGALAGFLLGSALAYGRDRFDPAVKSVEEIGRITGLPIIGEVSS
jgi:uncharacterized protein involved in exopolysaccharide biosynthesis